LTIADCRLHHSIVDWAIATLMIVSIMIGAIANAPMLQSSIECRNAAIDGSSMNRQSPILNRH